MQAKPNPAESISHELDDNAFMLMMQKRIDAAGGQELILGIKMHQSDLRIVAPWERDSMGNDMDLPPCMAAVAADLEAGKNAGHSARFALAAFLMKRDFSNEEIARYFLNAPNYDEKITERQIASVRTGGYAPMGCDKLRSLGLCREDAECRVRGLTTPLGYPRKGGAS